MKLTKAILDEAAKESNRMQKELVDSTTKRTGLDTTTNSISSKLVANKRMEEWTEEFDIKFICISSSDDSLKGLVVSSPNLIKDFIRSLLHSESEKRIMMWEGMRPEMYNDPLHEDNAELGYNQAISDIIAKERENL